MPPRHAFWTIILEGKPTAFRAHSQEELLPTLRQLQARHADALMMWFARGRLWRSPDEERAEQRRDRGERRGPAWRPGGAHIDPRDRFKIPRDQKRRQFAQNQRRDRPAGRPEEREGWVPRFDERGGWNPRDRSGGRPKEQGRAKPSDRLGEPPEGHARWKPGRPPADRPAGGSFGRSTGRRPSGAGPGPRGKGPATWRHGTGGRPGGQPLRRDGSRKPGGGRRGGGGSTR